MGIMLVYDITNEKSFDNIKNWIRNIEEHASADVEKMILGNKCDMNDRRQVSLTSISFYILTKYYRKLDFHGFLSRGKNCVGSKLANHFISYLYSFTNCI